MGDTDATVEKIAGFLDSLLRSGTPAIAIVAAMVVVTKRFASEPAVTRDTLIRDQAQRLLQRGADELADPSARQARLQ